MPLLAYNLTSQPLVLPSPNNPSVVLPSALFDGFDGPSVDVTFSLYGLPQGQYSRINDLVLLGKARFEWTDGQQYSTPGLSVALASTRSFSNLTRPAANAVGATVAKRVEIWNTDTNMPNYSNGTNWYDTLGQIVDTPVPPGIFHFPIPSFSNLTRPAANAVGATVAKRVEIWNTDDNSSNYSNGTSWFDAEGNIT